jgi:Dolichyl-phosphate-mannose-protein mannosyltransferase
MALQFESSLQNLVYQVDAGTGRKVIQVVLFALFAFAMGALYTFSNFQGLKDARAMDYAQLARQHATEGEWATQCVRPLSLWKVAAESQDGDAALLSHPDLFHPPVWQALLSTAFWIGGMPKAGAPSAAFVYGWDYLPVALNHLFTALSSIWVWLIGRKLFDRRVGALSAGAFLISDLVWQQSLLGADLAAATFFCLGAVYCALWAAELPSGTTVPQEQGPVWRWLVPLLLASLCTALAFLTRYAAGSVVLLVFLYLGISRRNRSWAKASLYLALTVLLVLPWLSRNLSLSGNPFGLVFHEMLSGTYLFPGDSLMRSIHPVMPDPGAIFYAVQIKMVSNLRVFISSGFGLAGTGILLSLFAVMYFHRFMRPSSRTLRWCILPAAAVGILFASAYGEESLRTLSIYWPLAIPYGWAFFLVLLDRLQFEVRFLNTAALTAVMFLTGLPLLMNVLPPNSGIPYPPYFHRYAGWVGSMLEPEECLTTDMPWATSWYGGGTSILLPRDIDGFYEINEEIHPIALAYFTTITRDKPWVRGLADPSAPEFSWYQVFADGKVPGNFPLTHGRFIAGSDQLVLADHPRW